MSVSLPVPDSSAPPSKGGFGAGKTINPSSIEVIWGLFNAICEEIYARSSPPKKSKTLKSRVPRMPRVSGTFNTDAINFVDCARRV
jgi:hypothetical protein